MVSAGNRTHQVFQESRVFPLRKYAVSWDTVGFRMFEKIIISGPQRSGTTYFTKALSKYLDYTHIDEFDGDKIIAVGNEAVKVFESDDPFCSLQDLSNLTLIKTTEAYVAQRPQWSSILHLLPAQKNLLIIFMARNCLDVFESQNKIMGEPGNTGWTCKFGRQIEWQRYNQSKLRDYVNLRGMICTIKQEAMLNYQMKVMEDQGSHFVILDYSSLESFPGYVSSENRLTFKAKQVDNMATGQSIG